MTRIVNLTPTETVSDSDIMIVSDGSLTKKITVSNLSASLIQRASRTTPGVVRVGNGLDISESGVLSVRNFSNYELPVASTTTLGGVMVGTGLAIDGNGVLSSTLSIPVASPSVLGGIKVGEGLVIDNVTGTLSINPLDRNKFVNGIIIGNDNFTISYLANIPTIKDLTAGSFAITVADVSSQSGVTGIRVLSAAQASLAGGSEPAVIATTATGVSSLGTPMRKWKAVYADSVYGNLYGSLIGNTEGVHKGALRATDDSLAFDPSTKMFLGTLTGNVIGNADTATKLFEPIRINDVLFDGTTDIVVEDNTKLDKVGGILSGFLTLHAEPTNNRHAATKQYVDTRTAEKLSLFGGIMQGFITLNDPPQQTLHAATKGYVDGEVNTRLRLAGGTMTGPLTLDTDPVNSLHAATKVYVDRNIEEKIFNHAAVMTQYVDNRDLTKVNKAGDTMTGHLTLTDQWPTELLHAASKQYVDTTVYTTDQSTRAYVDARDNTRLALAGGEMAGYIKLHNDPTEGLHAATKNYADSKLALIGGTLTGYLTLHNDPTQDFHAASKRYTDTKLSLSGGSMTGHVRLNADPTDSFHAATKQYVDTQVYNWDQVLRAYVDARDNTKLAITGGTMQGFISLHADPTSNSHASTKRYVDSAITSGLTAYDVIIKLHIDNTLDEREQVLRAYIDARDNTKLSLSGGTMTGFITLHSNPTANLHAATKKYVDDLTDTLDSTLRLNTASQVANAQYYDIFANGVASPSPMTFREKTIRGFSAYNSTDFPGAYFGGITVNGPGNVRSGQIAFNWNSEESAPTGLFFRVNDDTSATNSWSPWSKVATKAYVDSVLPTIAYAKFVPGNGAIIRSRYVTSVSRLATGKYRVFLTSGVFDSSDYIVTANCGEDHVMTVIDTTTSYVDIYSHDPHQDNNAYSDPGGYIHVMITL